MTHSLATAEQLLPGVRLEPVEILRGSDRAIVQRATAIAADRSSASVIVKQFRVFDESWVREAAALSVLPAGALAPRLLAQASDPPLVLMTDLGTGRSVADDLLGADRQALRADQPPRRRGTGRAVAGGHLPELAELAGRLSAVLTDRWGAVPLGYAPAFARQ